MKTTRLFSNVFSMTLTAALTLPLALSASPNWSFSDNLADGSSFRIETTTDSTATTIQDTHRLIVEKADGSQEMVWSKQIDSEVYSGLVYTPEFRLWAVGEDAGMLYVLYSEDRQVKLDRLEGTDGASWKLATSQVIREATGAGVLTAGQMSLREGTVSLELTSLDGFREDWEMRDESFARTNRERVVTNTEHVIVGS